MGRRIIRPEEQLQNVARALLRTVFDPDQPSRREEVRYAVEILVEMTQRLLDGELEPIEEPAADSSPLGSC
jgi:hypothetical protein